MLRHKKALLSLITLAAFAAIIAISLSPLGRGLSGSQSQAHAAHPTKTLQNHATPAFSSINEYNVPGGSLPWGTAYDKFTHRLWVALPGCDPTPMCSSNTPPGKIAIFKPDTLSWGIVRTLPAGYAQPLFLAVDKHSNVWFPMPMNNSIGTFNAAKHTFQQWQVPTAGAGPWDIAIDAQGMIWFTEHYTNKIGRFNPVNHTFMEVSTPATNSQPYGITVDASGNVWFTENNASVALIAEYTTGNTLLEYKIRDTSDPNLTPHLITVDHSGNIWWSEGFAGKIGELQVAQAQPGTTSGVSEYAYTPVCNCGEHTSGIGVDSQGNVWFDDSLQSIFGSFAISSSTFSTSNTPTSNSHPHDGLTVDTLNRVWFDEEFANKIGLAH